MRARLNLGRVLQLVALVVVAGYAPAACTPGAAWALVRKPFGLAMFELQPLASQSLVNEGTKLRLVDVPYTFTQAGGHPWALSATYDFTTEEIKTREGKAIVPTQDPKDVVTTLPPGMLGNPNPKQFPLCPLAVVLAGGRRCPADTQIGVARVRFYGGEKESLAPIVNVTPEKGQSAEFGIETTAKVTFLLTAHVVRLGKTYGLAVVSNSIPLSELDEVEGTFWGVPADPSHDAMRGLTCSGVDGLKFCENGNRPSGLVQTPFLTWPADCSAGPLTATVRADSWEEPGSVREGRYVGYSEATASLPGVSGCNLLKFEPELEIKPDLLTADSPVGTGINLKVPQVEGEDPNAPATPQLRDSVVTLPEGMSINPSIVDGIEACDESGPEGINFEGPESEEVGANGELRLAPGHCPGASTIGEAEAESPLLPEPVKGHVYLARPLCGQAGEAPCSEEDAADGNLYQMYLELGGTGALADTGINFKVRFRTEANPGTGQLTAVVEDTPQLPFSELRIRLNGGPRAGLANPFMCGTATTTAHFTPWSAPGVTPEGSLMAGTADAVSSPFFDVSGCASPPSLNPSFVAGMATNRAGGFGTFTMNIARKDREQYIKGIQLHTPPGLLAMLSSISPCGDAEASAGTCPQSSEIGSIRVASGAGSHPFEIEGTVYLTGPHDGAPFGLAIVTRVVAGPFNLGVVVVRARIEVDRKDATATITTDESGPDALPQVVFGVPLRLKRVIANIERPDFMLNPTNCSVLHIVARVSSSQNGVAQTTSPFEADGCKNLTFKPNFTVDTSGRTSRANGASLDARLSFPKSSLGKEANIAKVKVSLPKQLPSRLSTLQKACPAETFERDPAACPKGSIVGVARAYTPVLPRLQPKTGRSGCRGRRACSIDVPTSVEGPVYFVSHGGEAFPSLIVVLQGDGVRVDLVGTTFISRAGITSSTFKTVPDVPVDTFELYLPQGKDSALAANGNLCSARAKLRMPTTFVAQNGAQVRQTTKIAVTGCATGRAKRSAHK